MADGQIEIVITGESRGLQSAIGNAGEALMGLKGIAAGAMGIVAGAVGVGVAAVTGLGVAAMKSAAELDEAYDLIAISTGAVGDTLRALQDDFKAVFATGPDQAQDVSTAIGELNTRLGLTGKPLQDLSRNLLDVSRLLGGDVAQNTRLFSRAIGDWGVPVNEASGLLDKLFVAGQQTGISFDRLNALLVQFGAPLRLMNFSLDESIALLAKWEKEGVNTELVIGSLRIAAGNFAEQQIPLRQGLESTISAIQSARSESDALSIAMQVFGARAGPDMAAAIREGRFSIDGLVESLSEADGAVASTVGQTAGLEESLSTVGNKLKIAFAVFGDEIRARLEPLLVKLVPIISAVIDEAIKFAPRFGEAIDAVAGFLAHVGGEVGKFIPQIVAAGDTVGTMVSQLIDEFGPAFSDLASALFEFASVVIPGAISAMKKYFELLRPGVEIVTQVVGSFIRAIGDLVKAAVGALAELIRAVTALARGDFADFGAHIVNAARHIVDGVTSAFESMIQGVANAFGRTGQQVLDHLRWLNDQIKAVMTGTWMIRSPSQVFSEYGEMMLAGLVAGMQRAQPVAEEAIGKTARSVSNTFILNLASVPGRNVEEEFAFMQRYGWA